MKKNNPENIDDILKEYGKQKRQHIERFGDIEPPEKSERQKAAEKAETGRPAENGISKKKEKRKYKRPEFKRPDKKSAKKIIIAAAAVIAAAGIIGGSIGISNYTKTSYLKPYEEKYPNTAFPQGIQERFCDYYAMNPSTVGYIEIPDCEYKDYVYSNGDSVPVLDRSNKKDALDFNTVIYFKGSVPDLEKAYSSADAFSAAEQKIKFSTLYEDYEFNVIGAFYTNSNPYDDGGYCFPYNVTKEMTGKSLTDYTDRLTHRFLYNTEYIISSKDRLITLAAKSDFMPDFRFIVVGVLDADKQNEVTPNRKVHYPQAWYDANNQTNPYRFSGDWYPVIKFENSEETSEQTEKDFLRF